MIFLAAVLPYAVQINNYNCKYHVPWGVQHAHRRLVFFSSIDLILFRSLRQLLQLINIYIVNKV